MNSRERVIAAMRREDVDYVPLSTFFSESQVEPGKYRDWQRQDPYGEQALRFQVMELGIDPVIPLDVPVGQHPEVSFRVWETPGKPHPILHKRVETPAGPLTAAVRRTPDWPHGMDVPLLSDFNVSRFVKPWLENMDDVERWAYLHMPPGKREVEVFKERMAKARVLAQRLGLATMVTIGMGLTAAFLLFGVRSIRLSVKHPEVIESFLEVEHETTMRQLKVALENVDIVRRNGFYETTDFWSPRQLQNFLEERLRDEAEQVRSADRVCCYTVCTGVMPILDYLAELPFDAYEGIEPALGNQDMRIVAQKLGSKKCIWGGVSAPVHIGLGNPETVRKAVQNAFQIFGWRGFILHAVPSIREQWPWENVSAR